MTASRPGADPTIDPGQVEALLFDLGGVVIEIDFGRCFTRWARVAGRPPEEIRARFRMDEAYEAHERGELDIGEYLATLRHALDLDLSDEALLAGWNDIYVGPVPDVCGLLPEAGRRFRLAAFTNSNPTHQATWSVRFAADLDVFESVFVSSELGLRKPERAAFHEVARLLGVPPSGILFFDDSPENVTGARAAGLQAVEVRDSRDVVDSLAVLGIGPRASGPADRQQTWTNL